MKSWSVRTPKVDWRQAGAESLLLLIGVLLALAGQAWWEGNSEKETVREYAANLQLEVSDNRKELQKAIERHESYIAAGKHLVDAMQSEVVPETARSVELSFTKLSYISDFRPATSALKNLVGAGGLGSLESADLQFAISKYAQSIENHNVLQSEYADYFFGTYIPFISQHVSLLDVEFVDSSLGLPKTSRFGADLTPLFQSMAYENTVVRRISAELDAKVFAERCLEATDELLSALKESDF